MGLGAIGDLIAHAGLERHHAAIGERGIHLAFQAQDHVPLGAPVIGGVAGRVLHHAHADAVLLRAEILDAPDHLAAVAGMALRSDRRPVGGDEGNVTDLHRVSPGLSGLGMPVTRQALALPRAVAPVRYPAPGLRWRHEKGRPGWAALRNLRPGSSQFIETATKRTSPCPFETSRRTDFLPSFFSASSRLVTSAGALTGSWPTSTI